MAAPDTRPPAVLSLRQRARRALGIESIDPLWRPIALAAHRRKLARDRTYRDWCESVGWPKISAHWGAHETVEGDFLTLHLASQLYEITELLRRRIGAETTVPVLDAGASDGLFLSRIGARDGVGLNLLPDCVAQIAADGYRAEHGTLEHLPFEDDAFAIVLCCETLEHVLHPIAALEELARVCSGTIHLTIPWLRSGTRITARPAGWPDVEGHVFEFSRRDLLRIVTYANLEVTHEATVQVFPEPRNPLLRLWLELLMYPNFFPKLQYYELRPSPRR